MSPKFYIGPMTKNVIDAVIEINNKNKDTLIGLIPSRRQIEYDGGYVNNWTTNDFCTYVKKNSKYTLLKRDHGGEGQGKNYDDGLESYKEDIKNGFDYIHIDPWKKSSDVKSALEKTINNIKYCLSLNPEIKFEVGTEQAIFPYSEEDLFFFLDRLKFNLSNDFKSIKYGVVQGGTKISDTINLGNYDKDKLSKMCKIVNNFGLLSKEHNGDYLSRESIYDRFLNGLNAINIAPEFGVYETKLILNNLSTSEKDEFYNTCYESKKWEKWVSKDFDFSDKIKLIEICGHYNLMSNIIINFKNNNPKFDIMCKDSIINYIEEKLL